MFFLFLFHISSLFAEPWLANRFAQNCAACHAPGRNNLPAADRRCSLSCQGCHVNPNGGGLRNAYGKWNEDRWLSSFRTDLLKHSKPPAPFAKQKYATSGKRSELVVTEETNEEEYSRADGQEQIVVEQESQFLAHIPRQDPYYTLRSSKVTGGADVRWQAQSRKWKKTSPMGDTSGKSWKSFLMTADIGLDWRPLYKRYHLVYEGRFRGNAEARALDNFGETMERRNFYMLVDDLDFNSYVMAGYYRPSFGLGPADHTLLSQRMISYALHESPYLFDLQYKSVSLGTAPNVPYLNVHLMQKEFSGQDNDTHKAVAVSFGTRFVTMGASFNYSFWNARKEREVTGEEVMTRLQMHALSGGIHVLRTILNVEAIGFLKDVPNQAYRKGAMGSVEALYRVWREMYLLGQFSQSNLTESLTPGMSRQFRFGVRGFFIPGVEGTLQWGVENHEETGDEPEAGSDLVSQDIQGQIHLFL